MTQALCFECGHIKFGSFAECPKYDQKPTTDEELVLSIAVSNHHFSLEEFGKELKAGKKFNLDKEWEAEMIETIKKLRISGVLKI